MNELQAMHYFLKFRPQHMAMVKKLMAWDERATLRENAKNIGGSVSVASSFQKGYGLKYKRVKGWSGPKPASLKVQAFIDLKERGWPMAAIADLFELSRQGVQAQIKDKQHNQRKWEVDDEHGMDRRT